MWLIFLSVNPDFTDAFARARELGYQVALVRYADGSTPSPGGLADRELQVDQFSMEALLFQLQSQGIPLSEIQAFWTLRDDLTFLTAQLNERLPTPPASFTVDQVVQTKDKFRLRQLLDGTGYNPKYRLISPEDPGEIEKRLAQKTVLKPIAGFSSIGVEMVTRDEDFAAALARTRDAVSLIEERNIDFPIPFPGYVLEEEFIEGEEVSVEILLHKGELCFGMTCGKSKMQEPFFEEVAYFCPANLGKSMCDRLLEAGQEILRRAGIDSGVAHIEFKITASGEIKVLDLGLRLGGSGLTHEMAKIAFGVDLVGHVIHQVVSSPDHPPLDLRIEHHRLAALYLLQVGEGGVLKNLPSADTPVMGLRAIKAEHFASPGQELRPYPRFSGHPGYFLFDLPQVDHKKAHDLIDSCQRKLRLEYE